AQEVVDEYYHTQKISLIDDIITRWDFLGAYYLDGTQLYENKESDCWIVIWIVINLLPATCYCKMHVCHILFSPSLVYSDHLHANSLPLLTFFLRTSDAQLSLSPYIQSPYS
ncbi:hypothetical protein V8E55_003883, partial [Tylopilus felleus]